MRKLLLTAAALAVGAVLTATSSQAGGERKDWVCWMQPSGVSECAWLKHRHYHIHVMRAHRHERDCNHCAIPFKLDHDKIEHLDDEHVNTKTMRAYHDATVYGDSVRKNAHKKGH
jgi:hypothetical protein